MQKKHSGKMGAIALPVALIAAAVGVLLWMLTGAQGYRAADWTDTDGQRYYRNLVTHQAFAADVDWDGSDGAVIVIPDEVHGYKVTALGGYIGRGVPTAFALNAPEIWNTQVVFGDEKVAADAEKDYPNAKVVDCTVTLRLGRNVKALNEVSCFGWQGYDENGAETVWRLRWNVECDEGNETFYAKGGRLYRCADGAAVEAFRCARCSAAALRAFPCVPAGVRQRGPFSRVRECPLVPPQANARGVPLDPRHWQFAV